jgi:hypothetical protein
MEVLEGSGRGREPEKGKGDVIVVRIAEATSCEMCDSSFTSIRKIRSVHRGPAVQRRVQQCNMMSP